MQEPTMFFRNNRNKKVFCDQGVQTVIQHIGNAEPAPKGNPREKQFLSLLEYTPYQQILEASVGVIELPALHIEELASSKLNLNNFLFLDDDGLSELILELRERQRWGLRSKGKTSLNEGTQSNLHVEPHLLEADEVARVMVECAVQTD